MQQNILSPRPLYLGLEWLPTVKLKVQKYIEECIGEGGKLAVVSVGVGNVVNRLPAVPGFGLALVVAHCILH